jgi:hypothetical protein
MEEAPAAAPDGEEALSPEEASPAPGALPKRDVAAEASAPELAAGPALAEALTSEAAAGPAHEAQLNSPLGPPWRKLLPLRRQLCRSAPPWRPPPD